MDALRKSQGKPVSVWVDTEVARDNVIRVATRKGFKVETRPEGDAYVIGIEGNDYQSCSGSLPSGQGL
jgi:hypothetical protein